MMLHAWKGQMPCMVGSNREALLLWASFFFLVAFFCEADYTVAGCFAWELGGQMARLESDFLLARR